MSDLLKLEVKLRWDPAHKAEEIYPVTVKRLKAILEQWHAQTMPGHFERTAMAKYGYEPRKVSYWKRKAPAGGQRRPLVWTGRLEVSAKAAKTIKVVGKTKVKGRLSIWGGWPKRRRELFTTTTDEQTGMMLALRETLVPFLKAPTSSSPQPLASGAASAGG